MTPNITKFGFFIRKNYSSAKEFYTKNHEWIRISQDENLKARSIFRARIGITDYSQKALGDIVFIEMPKIETKYNAEGMQWSFWEFLSEIILDTIAVVESVKGASDIYCPISGTITSINSSVIQKPSILNKSPENDGWICEIESDEKNLKKAGLLSHQDYIKYCKSEQ